MIPWFQIEQIHLGPLTIQVWGLLVSLGFALGAFVAWKEAKRKGVDANIILDLFILILAGAIIGGRLFYVAEHYKEYITSPLRIFLISEGGMSFFGGFLAALAAGVIFVRRKKLPVRKITDTLAPALAAGYGIGRFGCLFIHDHLGKITNFFLGIKTPEGVVRHEPIIYEIIFNGFLLFSVLWFLRKRIKQDGILSAIFLVWFLSVRFITDFFRATDLPESDIKYYGLTLAQITAIILLMGAAVFFINKYHNFSAKKV